MAQGFLITFLHYRVWGLGADVAVGEVSSAFGFGLVTRVIAVLSLAAHPGHDHHEGCADNDG